jgi:multidrug efflux pump subunit AcrA (membrane-fusion protein)
VSALAVRYFNQREVGSGETDLYTVRRGTFDMSVPSSGELAALSQIEIRNNLDTRATIEEIVKEGMTVKAGDVILRLADEDILNKIKDAEDAVKNAEAASITAQSNLDIRESSSQSELDKADLKVMLAELALQAWKEGEVKSTRQQLATAEETADINYNRLSERFEESKKLFDQKFISYDEFQGDRIAKIEAEAKLERAKLDIEVYEKYDHVKDKAQKESDVDQAKAERERIAERHKAELETVRAEVASKKHQLESRRERLEDLQEQLTFCTVEAPSGGLVVYASSLEQHRWSRGDTGGLQVGSELHKNELVMVLPDTSVMTANVKVNEALSGLIVPEQQAVVKLDAVPEAALSGEVISIGVLAESGGWRDPNRRDYTVKIKLTDGDGLGLKPSMRCQAEIFVGRVEEALHIPMQAIFHDGAAAFVYVPDGAGFAQRKVVIGRTSDTYVEIISGLEENELVLLREPRPEEIMARLPEASDQPPKFDRPMTRRAAKRDQAVPTS